MIRIDCSYGTGSVGKCGPARRPEDSRGTPASLAILVRFVGLAGLLVLTIGTMSGGLDAGATGSSALPPAPVWTSHYIPQRPTSCSTPTAKSVTSKPTTGETSSENGSVPWPAAPPGTD